MSVASVRLRPEQIADGMTVPAAECDVVMPVLEHDVACLDPTREVFAPFLHVALVLVQAEMLLAADGAPVLHLANDIALRAPEVGALDVLLGVVDVPAVVVVSAHPVGL